jgi:alpha-amylase
MVAFRNIAAGTSLTNWWDNGGSQIAFCRGDQAFIAFNNENYDMNQSLQVSLIFLCILLKVYTSIDIT